MAGSPLFHRTELLVGPDVVDRLAATRVILFGVGGVGSWCAEALVRSGIGHLAMVDADAVCITNVNRQLQATPEAVGQPKVVELQKRLQTINPGARVDAITRIFGLATRDSFDIGNFNYVLDAVDSLSNKLGLIEYAVDHGATLFSAMGASAKLDPTRIKVSSIWETEVCPLARRIRKRLHRHGFAGDFLCLYSDEYIPNHSTAPICGTAECHCPRFMRGPDGEPMPAHEWCSSKKKINGSMVHVTATFGMMLAGLVVQDVVRRAADAGGKT